MTDLYLRIQLLSTEFEGSICSHTVTPEKVMEHLGKYKQDLRKEILSLRISEEGGPTMVGGVEPENFGNYTL